MKLRKIEWYELPNVLSKKPKKGSNAELAALRKEFDWVKSKKPEYVGGSGSVGSYHRVEETERRFAKTAFHPGINVIGVASGLATTIWLPKELEPNHLIAVKDELGLAAQHPITIKVFV